ncbi:SDR family NAD(P)-dependent oxidoreductase [Methylobacterium symbioticum]|nr:SDR family NAD(P)-dependent oxidoreductase [uncultured Methylobacterium sp.]
MEWVLSGRTCLVTGATNGIGYETALGLARRGARVVLVGRDAERLARAEAGIRAAVPGADLAAARADLSAQAEIRRLAAEIRAGHARLDVLVNNAGAIFDRRAETVDGIERTWALDHLGYVLLTLELLDLLKDGGRAGLRPRIVNVASAAHTRGRIDLDDLEGRRRYGGMTAYAQAKLGNVLFTAALARRLAGSGVTVNALHPGVIRSGFARDAGGLLGFGWSLIRPFLSSPERGAATSLHLACAPELDGVSGRYFARCAEARPSRAARNVGLQERVWEISLGQIGA